MKAKTMDLGTFGYTTQTFNTPHHEVNYLLAHIHVPMSLSAINYTALIWIMVMGGDELVVQAL